MKRHRIFSCAALLLALSILFLACSCGQSKQPALGGDDLLKDRTAAVSAKREMTEAFPDAMAAFSFSLFQNALRAEDRTENKLLSPFSALLCLALVENGTAGETRRQMCEALGLEPETLNAAISAYAESLPDSTDAKLRYANAVWFRDADFLHVEESFLQTVVDWYDAEVRKAPFNAETVKDINRWCEYRTDGMIKEIIEQIEPDDVLYLVNALVFDAKWETEYEESQISEGQFRNANGTNTPVTYLSSEETVYLSAEGVKGVAKPYRGGAYSFVGLLPTDESANVAEFAASLTGEQWIALWKTRRNEKVQTRIPEFKCEDRTALKDLLIAMGMTDLFNPGAADLSAMGRSDGGNLYVSCVDQKTYLELDRKGTKAAAVTWATVKTGGAFIVSNTVYLDRPFVYLIVDNATGLPLFLGITENL